MQPRTRNFAQHPVRELSGLVIAKAAVMATVALAVIKDRSLSTFDQALIIAITSATITGIFTVTAAYIAVRATRPIKQEIHEAHQVVKEISSEQMRDADSS